jgi:subtilase family serine protease
MYAAVRRLVVATGGAVVAVTTAVVVGAGPAGAGPAGPLPLGCANPANHSSATLLAPTAGSASEQLTCFGEVQLAPAGSTGPIGLVPTDIEAAYGISGSLSGGGRVAVVAAYDDPNAEADLAVYRTTFGVPACTTSNRCFRKVNSAGSSAPLPATDYGWAEEISLDLDAVSATCPRCRILLVEAASSSAADLLVAVDTAARLGATAVSMSFGGNEDSTIRRLDAHLNHSGVNMVAASGDNGYGVQWPASSGHVTAVGGTTLSRAPGTRRGWRETAWSGSGSGCSGYEPKPSWQSDLGCSRRTVADVAAVADPNTGLAAYDTFNNCIPIPVDPCDSQIGSGLAQGLNGWAKMGGTSLSTPIVASIYALTTQRRSVRSAYSFPKYLHDVTSGSNGVCAPKYLCTARTGYDGPTGMGTPKGTNDF